MKKGFGKYPILSALLEQSGLKFVDIGGRGSGLKSLLSLARHVHYFVSEPEAAEAARLGETLLAEQAWRDVTVFSDAIASSRGESALYITRLEGMSSLLEPDPEVTRRFCNAGKYEIDATQTVSTIPLDDAAAQHGFTDACFLKMDTQGTELDIARSGERLLNTTVLGVYAETNFQPFYKQQPLFAELDSYLRAQGLSLFSMNRTALRRNGYRSDVYSKRVLTWAHCLYLREPATLLRRGEDAARRDLPRLLALAITFQFYDLAFEIVELCRTVAVLPASELDGLAGEMERLARYVTKRVLKDAARPPADPRELMLSPSLRDKNRIE